MKMKRASAAAHGLLERAGAQISHDDFTSAVNSIYRALVTYAADKSNRSPQDITAKTAGSVLEGIQGITGSTKEEFIGLFDTCMMMKFSITSIEDRDSLLALRDKSVRIIDRMESEWLKNQK
jgi:hypothetical protein